MNTSDSRSSRRIWEGTGVYIALFLVVTALAVAGYWTLIPHHSNSSKTTTVETATAAAPRKSETIDQTPALPAQPVKREPAPVSQENVSTPAPAGHQEAAPAQSVVPLTIADYDTPDIAPVVPQLIVPPLNGEELAAFSMDELRYSETMGDWRTHDGVDIAAETGQLVQAACAGTVTDVRDDDLMGTTVILSHDNGYDTLYANLEEVATVGVGDSVSAGEVIGAVGRTALSESSMPPHLHFAVTRDGEYVDPAEFLNQ